jgi:uncharacterized membrane protein YhaH (DUF805 family)
MTFVEAATAPLAKLHVLAGRSSRKEFWSFLLVLWLVALVVALATRQLAPDLLAGLALPVLLAEYLLLWGVAVRRMHDTGKSGYLLLVAFVPLVGLLTVAVLLAMAGDPGANRYGPSPYEAGG